MRAFPLHRVQYLPRLREKLVERICRSGNVDDHRLALDVHDNEPVFPSLHRKYRIGGLIEGNARLLAADTVTYSSAPICALGMVAPSKEELS